MFSAFAAVPCAAVANARLPLDWVTQEFGPRANSRRCILPVIVKSRLIIPFSAEIGNLCFSGADLETGNPAAGERRSRVDLVPGDQGRLALYRTGQAAAVQNQTFIPM